jgi:hypothetical protein
MGWIAYTWPVTLTNYRLFPPVAPQKTPEHSWIKSLPPLEKEFLSFPELRHQVGRKIGKERT